MILQITWVSWLTMLLLLWPIATVIAGTDVKPGCQEKCGNVSVPYPFGIGEESCAMNKRFFLNCTNNTEGHPELVFGRNLLTRNISVLQGTITTSITTVFNCYNKSGNNRYGNRMSISLGSGPFTFSDTRNIFTAVGCDVSGRVTNEEFTYGTSCMSLCTEYVNMSDENPCSGSGCCRTSIPKGLKSLNISSANIYNHTKVTDFNPCGFAILADKSSFKLSDWPLSRKPNYVRPKSEKRNYTSDVVVEWRVKNETCEQAKLNTSTYACGTNAYCTYPENDFGYHCLCNEGFQGNPYLREGCQGFIHTFLTLKIDIDECKDPVRYPCEGTCKNIIGDYKCRCPLGMYGDGKKSCRGFGISTIVAGEYVPFAFAYEFLSYKASFIANKRAAADEGEMEEIEAVADLTKRCLNSIGINRPSMKEVSDELAKLKALHENSWTQQNSDETEHLLGESSQSFLKNASPPMTQSQTLISFEIENYTDSI
ncbi:unnamed protein product [Dovyalis caffra]|uniref:EGF-like domain-containing protein n=1 Tax=Dovyalis caffra TaxID=77055 RepID=A0AAV1R5M9_9ROSI|nr:unnamed protein product [Dovyalis caffra]